MSRPVVASIEAVVSPALLLTTALLAADVAAQDIRGETVWRADFEDLPPGLVVIRVDSTYAISAVTSVDIGRELHENGPRLGPKHAWAMARSRTRHRVRYEALDQDHCRAGNATVVVRSVILMPEWVNRNEADRDLVVDWLTLTHRLRRHEESHRTLTLAAATKFIQQVEGLVGETCSDTKRQAEELWRATWAEGRRAQAMFDGRSVEIRWPPR